MMIKTILLWIWEKTPWWFKAPVIFIMTPIAMVVVILWYALFLPWQTGQIEATILSYDEKRDMKYELLVQKQSFINEQTKESLQRIDRHQVIMFEYMIRNQK